MGSDQVKQSYEGRSMSEDQNKHTVRFLIEIDVYGNTLDFYKDKKAEEVLNWIMAGRTKHVGCGSYIPDLPESVVPPMIISTPARIREEE
jgi:hypothetical protein